MTTNTNRAHAPTRATSTPSHRLVTLAAALAGTVTTVALSDDPASANTVATLNNCTVSPAADEIAFDVPALLATVRVIAGQVQVLHDMRCPDRHVEQRWIVESSPFRDPTSTPVTQNPVDATA